jgi:hypothetical protein
MPPTPTASRACRADLPASPASSPRATTSRTSCAARPARAATRGLARCSSFLARADHLREAGGGGRHGARPSAIGATMLLHCDFVYVSDEARLAMPFVALGAWCRSYASSLLVPQLHGPAARRRRSCLLGDPFTGAAGGGLRPRQRRAAGRRGGGPGAPRGTSASTPTAARGRCATPSSLMRAPPARAGACRPSSTEGEMLRPASAQPRGPRGAARPSSRSAGPTSAPSAEPTVASKPLAAEARAEPCARWRRRCAPGPGGFAGVPEPEVRRGTPAAGSGAPLQPAGRGRLPRPRRAAPRCRHAITRWLARAWRARAGPQALPAPWRRAGAVRVQPTGSHAGSACSAARLDPACGLARATACLAGLALQQRELPRGWRWLGCATAPGTCAGSALPTRPSIRAGSAWLGVPVA